MERFSIFALLCSLMILTSCSSKDIQYDANGKMIKVDDPGTYNFIDRCLMRLGYHGKTDAIIIYSEYLAQEGFENIAQEKLSSASKDTLYWFVPYYCAVNNLSKDDDEYKLLSEALKRYDHKKVWKGVTIDKSDIYRRLSLCLLQVGEKSDKYFWNEGYHKSLADTNLYRLYMIIYPACGYSEDRFNTLMKKSENVNRAKVRTKNFISMMTRIYSNRSDVVNNNFYNAITYAQKSLLLTDTSSNEYDQSIKLIAKAHLELMQYDKSSFWIAKMHNKAQADSIRIYCKRIRMHRDSLEKSQIPDQPLYYNLRFYDLYTKSYGDFCKQISNSPKAQKRLYEYMKDNELYHGSFGNFYSQFFSYYEDYNKYIKQYRFGIDLRK